MNSGQNLSFSVRTPAFSLSREVKACLAVVLACHLLLIGWIVFDGIEPEPVITPPMTGMLLSGGSGTGAGGKGRETGGSQAGGSAPAKKQKETNDIARPKENQAASRPETVAATKKVKNPVLAKDKKMTGPSTSSTSKSSPQRHSSPAANTGNGTGQGTGSGTSVAGGGEGKGGSGFSGPYTDAGFFSNPKPPYPAVSRRMGEEGTVILRVHIQADGLVDEVKLKHSSGFSRLDESAMKTVRHWRYVPAKRNGRPIPYWYVQPIRFSLND